jgi:hypothetical protein
VARELTRASRWRAGVCVGVWGLRANLDKTTTQRDNHCAHAEILLKEKNRYSKETSTLKKELEAMHRAACEEADALARSARAAASSQRPASRPQSATVAPLKENNRVRRPLHLPIPSSPEAPESPRSFPSS